MGKPETRDLDRIPYAETSVTFIRWTPTGIEVSRFKDEKRAWLRDPSTQLYAAWTGQWRTDIFEIDREVACRLLKV